MNGTSSYGEKHWLHGDEALDSSRAILDCLNVFAASLFYVVLLLTRRISSRERRRDWFDTAVFVGCAVVSLEYYGVVAYSFITGGEGLLNLNCLIFLGRGFIWTTLAISVVVRGSRLMAVVKSTWWIGFFLLISVINFLYIVTSHRMQILEAAPWLANLLLLFSASRNLLGIIMSRSSSLCLSESLLDEGERSCRVDLDEASWWSLLLFSWMNPLLRTGSSRTLNLDDVPSLGSRDEALLAYENFEDVWSRSKLVAVHWRSVAMAGILALVRTVSVVSAPLFLYAFVRYSDRERKLLEEGLLLVGMLIMSKTVESFSSRHFYFYSRRIGMRMRSALMVAVYRKQLKLSSSGRRRHSSGEIVNYIAVDAYRLGESVMWFHVGWSSAVQLLLVVAVIYSVVGLGVVPGLVPLAVCGVLNVPFARLLQRFQTEFMAAQDRRLRSFSEILNSVKIIKLHAWEEKFTNLIESLREDEFEWLSKSQHMKTYGSLLYWMSPTIVTCVIFFGCLLFQSAPLDAGTVFTVMAALRVMSEPVRVIPDALSSLIQVKVSFDRISAFLLEDELELELKQPDMSESDADASDSDMYVISIQGGFFSWDGDATSTTLRDVALEARRGDKIAVCGPVGAGKSSLLYAVLGEIPKICGRVRAFGSVAYVSQASWIRSGTIRDNIIFGRAMDKAKYDEAIRVCALEKDLQSFDHGDMTEIGQRGLNLSGGQKQRLQLARAVYDDADIYLLDDPFSALDAHTAAAIFNDCVMTALANKTVILVTHQVEFLNSMDNILVVEGGKVTQSGSYEQLLLQSPTFEQLVSAHRNGVASNQNMDFEMEDDIYNHQSNEHERDITDTSPRAQLTEEEEKEVGDVGWRAISDYILISKGLLLACFTAITQLGFIVFQAAASIWLAFSVQDPEKNSLVVVGIYSLISLLSAVFIYFRSLFGVLLGLKASKSFFSGFTNSIFNAPMLFFDSTPVGRILTRASSDLSVLDFDIPMAFQFVLGSLFETLATIGIMAFVAWPVLFVGIFALASSKYVQGYYQKSAGELMRINGTTKAPIMNFASETALGVATIRAFRVSDKFFLDFLHLVDTDAKVFLSSNAALEWLVLRTEALQNLCLFASAVFVVVFPSSYIGPGLVGLCLSYAFALTAAQVFLSRWYSSLANYVVSVERIKQYMCIPPEPPAVVPDNRPPPSWPPKGRIELIDLKVRYRPNSPIVLKGISCTFKEGTRVGVVGRTGSGKTTLISALFRLVEPLDGLILVDGLDICSIGLRDLRLRLSIIPQEPTLFRGSVRTNLDPLGLHSDDEIWRALEKCQLKSTISKLPSLLDSSVSDEGENWSMGQRQLFCLGRVLLRRNKILVLDEATASIDSATDAILQKIIREEFAKCTVITVAHRVPTVIDSDMVLVLSYGKLVEYDEPSKLMETNSSFANLVAEYWSSCKKNY